ncbi:MAG: IS21-like element helper ATPase IstB [Acidimicrobiia bacterium]|nr:IS21-like element helper ATPase IstB [Acidimicrobiia bacterium]
MTQRHALLDRLSELKLSAMARGFEEQLADPEIEELSFEERLALLLDRESTERASRRLTLRLRQAKLRYPQAVLEDLDLRAKRGLDRSEVLKLRTCDWIDQGLNLLVTGATGTGKSFLGCALAHQACREGHTVLYRRLAELFRELRTARGDGSHGRLLQRIQRTHLLVLDDWGLHPFGDGERRDLYEILEDRFDMRSTMVLSQLPVDAWYTALGDPTLADAILDRLVHAAYRIALKGESQRKMRARTPSGAAGETK